MKKEKKITKLVKKKPKYFSMEDAVDLYDQIDMEGFWFVATEYGVNSNFLKSKNINLKDYNKSLRLLQKVENLIWDLEDKVRDYEVSEE